MVSKPVISSSISRSVSLISALAVGCGGKHEPPAPPAAPAAAAPTASASGGAAPAGAAPAGAAPAGGFADVVMVGGDIWTMDPQHPRVAAVAWRGDQVIGAGDDAAVRAMAGPSTKVIDLHGRSAT